MPSSGRFILRAVTADVLPLYIGEAGPTISRASAIEYGAEEMETRRANAGFVFGWTIGRSRSDRQTTRRSPSL
jgi:hypothetical protein